MADSNNNNYNNKKKPPPSIMALINDVLKHKESLRREIDSLGYGDKPVGYSTAGAQWHHEIMLFNEEQTMFSSRGNFIKWDVTFGYETYIRMLLLDQLDYAYCGTIDKTNTTSIFGIKYSKAFYSHWDKVATVSTILEESKTDTAFVRLVDILYDREVGVLS